MLLESPLWRSTPPAIFPVSLGLLGLGLGWRNASAFLPIPHEIGDILLALGSAFYLYFLFCYLLKLVARPMVLFDDMTNPPARAGIAAAAMAMMLLAAALLPLGISAPPIWWTGVILQIGTSAIGCYAIWRDPPEVRRFSTFQYLTFVGPVVGPVAGIPLGYVTESIVLTLAALVPYVVITVGFALQSRRTPIPQGLRPSLAILLAPISLFAISFGLLEFELAFNVFYWISSIVAAALLLRVPWMIQHGWSPAWAAFTFPIAAFLQVQVLAVAKGGGMASLVGVYAGLIIGTPVILLVVYRSMMMWVTGDLATQTGAAKA